MSTTIASDRTIHDWSALVDALNRFLRLRTTPISMKLYQSVAEMEAVPRIRRPSAVHTTDELLRAIPPGYLPKVIDGLDHLSRNGLRYPIAPYGVNNDARAGLGVSYGS